MTGKTRSVLAAAAAVLCVPAGAALSPAPAGAADADSCPPDRVTGVTYLLDALQTGAAVGPSIGWGVVQIVVGKPLPGALGKAQGELLAVARAGIETISLLGPAKVAHLKDDVALLAGLDKQANAVISASTDGLTKVADTLAPTIQPFDVTLRELAGVIRSTMEFPTC